MNSALEEAQANKVRESGQTEMQSNPMKETSSSEGSKKNQSAMVGISSDAFFSQQAREQQAGVGVSAQNPLAPGRRLSTRR